MRKVYLNSMKCYSKNRDIISPNFQIFNEEKKNNLTNAIKRLNSIYRYLNSQRSVFLAT